jgi:hypothetical protein
MNSDLMLVVGLIVAALSLPAVLNAWSESRAPRAGSIMVMIAIGLIVAAVQTKPGGYTVAEVPDVFFSVIGRLLN